MASPSEKSSYNFTIEKYAQELNAYVYFFPLHTSESYGFDKSGLGEGAYFKAYVNDFDENFASSWDAQQYYGKTDPIVGFKNTKRTISISWKIPSIDVDEAQFNFHQLSNLASMLYPEYMTPNATLKNYGIKKDDSGLSPDKSNRNNILRQLANQPSSKPLGKPPLIGVKWGNLVSSRDTHGYKIKDRVHGKELNESLVCHVDNFSMSPVFEMGFFKKPNDEYTLLFPKVWNCGIALNVQHTHELGRKKMVW